jgi:hypothetical protein
LLNALNSRLLFFCLLQQRRQLIFSQCGQTVAAAAAGGCSLVILSITVEQPFYGLANIGGSTGAKAA